MNKKLLIGLGVVAAAGVAYYLWKRNKDSKDEAKSGLAGVPATCNCGWNEAGNQCKTCIEKVEGKNGKWSSAAGICPRGQIYKYPNGCVSVSSRGEENLSSSIWGNNYYGNNKGKWRGRKNVPLNS